MDLFDLEEAERLRVAVGNMQRAAIAQELARRRWSQADLARASGLPRYTISRIMRGENLLTSATAPKILGALELTDLDYAVEEGRPEERSLEPARGIEVRPLDSGQEHVRLSLVLHRSTRMAIEAVIEHGGPLGLPKLAAILNILSEPDK